MRLQTAVRGRDVTRTVSLMPERPYRWRNTAGWDPAALPPLSPEPGIRVPDANRAAKEAAQARRELFAQYRAEGWTVTEAGELIGIVPETARKYEARRKKDAAGGAP